MDDHHVHLKTFIESARDNPVASAVLDTVQEAVIVADGSGAVVYMNRMAQALTGWHINESAGRQLDDICPVRDSRTGRIERNTFASVMTGDSSRRFGRGSILVTRGGAEITVDDTGSLFRDETGAPGGMVYIFRDITEKLMVEQQLRQSQKMDSIGQLAGGIAHDFNNMLAGILGGADILSMKLGPESGLREFVEMIMRSAVKASDLTGKLLAFSRKAKIESTPIDLHQTIGDAVQLLERSIDRRIDISLDLAALDHVVTGDPSQLENAILNLGVNARDAMPDGGKLTVSTENICLDDETCRTLGCDMRPGTFIRVMVRDTGIGMSPEILGKIFDPFFTTKAVGAGTGLGLAAVYGTMREHRGGIYVESLPGAGSSFFLYFPVAQGLPVPAGLAARPEHRGSGTVLVIDDEEVVRLFLREMLEGMSYQVIEAVNGRQGVDAAASGVTIDLAIIDLVMPVMNGRDTFREIRSIRPDLPVIISSGFSRDGSITDLLKSGRVWFLQKPYRSFDLASLMNEIFSNECR